MKMKNIEIAAFNEIVELSFEIHRYSNNRLAITAIDFHEGEHWGTLTINLSDEELAEDEIFVKTWSEGEVWVPQVLEKMSDIFEDTGKRVKSGFVDVPVWRLKIQIDESQMDE